MVAVYTDRVPASVIATTRFFALTMSVTLTYLPLYTAYAVWVALNELLLLVSLYFIHRLLPEKRHLLGAAILLTFFSPYYLEVYMGNSSFVAAALLLIAFDFYRRDRQIAFTALLTTSIVIKPLGLFFLPILLLRRQYATIAAVVVILTATAVPYFLLDPQGWTVFLSTNIGTDSVPGGIAHAANQGLYALFVTLCARLNGVATDQLSSLKQLPSACQSLLWAWLPALALVTVLPRSKAREQLGVAIFAWSAVYILGYKDVWEYSYTFLIPGLVYLWTSAYLDRRLILGCTIGLALPTALVLYDRTPPPGLIDPEHAWSLGISAIHHMTKPAFVAILYGAYLIRSWMPSGRASHTPIVGTEPTRHEDA